MCATLSPDGQESLYSLQGLKIPVFPASFFQYKYLKFIHLDHSKIDASLVLTFLFRQFTFIKIVGLYEKEQLYGNDKWARTEPADSMGDYGGGVGRGRVGYARAGG
jgi:hypothetical protein